MTDHHCHDPHCHDPNCDGHHHGHDHAHHDAPEHAAVFAAQRAYAPAAPVPRALLEQTAQDMFLRIGDACCVEGILPGHAKGLVEVAGGAFSLSLTCQGQVDTGALSGWAALDAVSAFTVTVNVHLIIPHALDGDALFAPFATL